MTLCVSIYIYTYIHTHAQSRIRMSCGLFKLNPTSKQITDLSTLENPTPSKSGAPQHTKNKPKLRKLLYPEPGNVNTWIRDSWTCSPTVHGAKKPSLLARGRLEVLLL